MNSMLRLQAESVIENCQMELDYHDLTPQQIEENKKEIEKCKKILAKLDQQEMAK